MKTLYSKTATGATNIWRAWSEGPNIITEWGQIDGKLQRSQVVALPKNEGKKNATTAEQQAAKEVEALIVKQLRLKYSESLETAGETNRLKPMLAGDYAKHKKKLRFPVTVQPKLNGLRCVAMKIDGKVVLQSRGGDYYPVAHIANALEPHLRGCTVLDGELYIHGESLQRITSLAKRPQPGSEKLTYVLYDAPAHGGNWEERLCWLQDFEADLSAPVFLIQNELADNHEQIAELFQSFVEQGYEGAIVRSHTGMYREGYRSPDLLKVKEFLDAEFKIVDWETGKGRDEKRPKFICETKDGKRFGAKCKGSDAVQAEMLAQAPQLIGEMLKVKYFELTPDGIPQFPVGLAIRYPDDMS